MCACEGLTSSVETAGHIGSGRRAPRSVRPSVGACRGCAPAVASVRPAVSRCPAAAMLRGLRVARSQSVGFSRPSLRCGLSRALPPLLRPYSPSAWPPPCRVRFASTARGAPLFCFFICFIAVFCNIRIYLCVPRETYRFATC